MPTYVLEGTTPVRLSSGPLRLSAQSTSGPVRIDVRSDGDAPETIRPTPQLLIVPRVVRRTRVTVSPVSGAGGFPAGTSVTLSLVLESSASGDPDRVQLPPVDVSGLSTGELLVLEPVGDFLEVVALGAQLDQGSPTMVGRARAAARAVLDVDRVPDQFVVRLVVAVDGSASMRRTAGDGDLEAALQVLLGLSGVIAPHAGLPRVAVLDTSVRWLEPTDRATYAAEVVQALVSGPDVVGFRSTVQGLRGLAPDENVVVYLVTDGVPADVDLLASENEVEGEARHLVLLGSGDIEATDGASLSAGLLPVTAVSAGLAKSSTGTYGDPLPDVVRSLMVGCFVPGTKLERRLQR